MFICYQDILSRIPQKPVWWLNGVPRYDEFKPDDLDVYARHVALVHTKCCCGTDYYQGVTIRDFAAFKDRALEGDVGMGDPPNACHLLGNDDCSSESTSCREIAIMEVWEKSNDLVAYGRWGRLSELELPLIDHFAEPHIPKPLTLDDLQLAKLERAHRDGGAIAVMAVMCRDFKIGMLDAKAWVDTHYRSDKP